MQCKATMDCAKYVVTSLLKTNCVDIDLLRLFLYSPVKFCSCVLYLVAFFFFLCYHVLWWRKDACVTSFYDERFRWRFLNVLTFFAYGTNVRRYNWHGAGSLSWPFPMLILLYIFFKWTIRSNLIERHWEAVVVWNYRNADCSLNLLCYLHYIILLHYIMLFTFCLQCFDTVGWVAGRASGL